MVHKLIMYLLVFTALSSLSAHNVFNQALKQAIARKNLPLALSIYAELSKNPDDKADVPQAAITGFKNIFKQDIDTAAQSLLTFNESLSAAGNNQDRIREILTDLMTNPEQPGGSILKKLPGFGAELGKQIAAVD